MKLGIAEREFSEKLHFDHNATNYDKNYRYGDIFTRFKIAKKTTEFARQIGKFVGDKSVSMLEVGCGTGEYTSRICNLFPQSKIVAIDISDKILQVAKKKCKNCRNLELLVGSVYSTKFRNNSFDVVYGFYILHHLDIDPFTKELRRILKPGGLAFFYEPNIINPAVFLVKSNGYLKRMVGDSEAEWGVNPLAIRGQFKDFTTLNISFSEFILPMKVIPPHLLEALDKITDCIKYLPIFKYLGGSVGIFLQKK